MMIHLFSAPGNAALRDFESGNPLFAFDFDGTLAPIVEHPDAARLSPIVSRLIGHLAERAPVAIVSGRSIEDLRHRVPDGMAFLVGNHGNEGLPGMPDDDAYGLAECAAWELQLKALALETIDPAIFIEHKGRTLSVHYRQAGDAAMAEAALKAAFERLDPRPSIITGKAVFNLLPPGGRTKYDAVRLLAQAIDTNRVLFAGDDVTDEIVFARAPFTWLTVRVGQDRTSKARFFLNHQVEIVTLLERLLHTRPVADRPTRA